MHDDDVKSVFLKAVEGYAACEWEAFLESECATAQTRDRVRRLLSAHLRGDPLLDQLQNPVIEDIGSLVGPYKLREVLGEGGFGVVFLAEQQTPISRQVALKIIKPGMDTRAVVARFEAERHALAMMSHPNIAQIYDAGMTESGRPYFAMELVRGVPLTAHCDQERLSGRERIVLFQTVCAAVQHAHEKGIIHRDLKPTNILVADVSGDAVVKVIDFGIAKALDQPLDSHANLTGKAQTIGTPLYMSPEQSCPGSNHVDARSDVYSLGCLLYELMTGVAPFDVERSEGATHHNSQPAVHDRDPLRPSTRVAKRNATSTTTASKYPFVSTIYLRGELDWIILKALEKDPTRRYETARGLSDDLQRFLCNEPVSACPPSVIYRAQKWFHRNHASMLLRVAAPALIVLSLLGIWQAYKSYRTSASLQHISSFLASSGQLASRGDLVQSEQHLRKAILLQETIFGPNSVATLSSRQRLAELLFMQQRWHDAVSEGEFVLGAQERVLGRTHPDTLRTVVITRDASLLHAWWDFCQVVDGKTVDLDAGLAQAMNSWQLHEEVIAPRDGEDDGGEFWIRLLLAWCHALRGDEPQMLSSLPDQEDEIMYPVRYYIYALFHSKMGERDLAIASLRLARTRQRLATNTTRGTEAYAFWITIDQRVSELIANDVDQLAVNEPSDDLSAFTQLIKEYQHDPLPYYCRGVEYLRQTKYRESQHDFAAAIELSPATFGFWHAYAVSSLYCEDNLTYAEHSREMVDRFRHRPEQSTAILLSGLLPVSGEALFQLEQLSQEYRGFESTSFAMYRLACGVLSYRRGHFQEAIESLPKDGDFFIRTMSHTFKAMAYADLGELEKARTHLHESQQNHNGEHDFLEVAALRFAVREAERVVQSAHAIPTGSTF